MAGLVRWAIFARTVSTISSVSHFRQVFAGSVNLSVNRSSRRSDRPGFAAKSVNLSVNRP